MPDKKGDDPTDLGAIWVNTSPRGTWFSLVVRGEKFVAFKNERKKPGDRQPDFRILKPKPKEPPPPGTHVRDEAVGTNEPIWGDEHRALLPDEEPPF